MLSRTWSPYQEAIYRFVEAGHGNAVVDAVPGSGKSTTSVEGARRARGEVLFLAFNKPIAEELKKRGVNARTFHSLCYMPVTNDRRTFDISSGKLQKLVKENLTGLRAEMYGSFIAKLVSLGRQQGIGCLIPDERAAWLQIIEHHELQLDNKDATIDVAVELASDLLGWSNKSKMVDYDDLLYFAVRDGLPLPRYDFIFVDEAQDTNAIQRAILRKVMRNNARLLAVGDPGQAIYGFRGADSESLNMIADEFSCIRLPLSVSYRCPVAVVEHARQWVSHIEYAPGAPAGEVSRLGRQWDTSIFQPADLIVCRTTKPIVSLAHQLIKKGIPARIQGRKISEGLTALVKRMGANTIEELEAALEEYSTRETEKAIAKGDEGKAEGIRDKVDTVQSLIHELPENDRTVARLLDTLSSLFSSKAPSAVVLSTIHRAKGLEADTVYWLNSESCPPRWARGWQKQQEINLCYVATTRAKQRLVLIED